MPETMGYVPPEAQPPQPETQSEQAETLELDLANPEFVEQAKAEVLQAEINEIGSTVIEGTGMDVADDVVLAKETLNEESSNGFLQGIKNSKFFKRMTILVVGASIAFSIAATAKAEAGPSPEDNQTEDVDDGVDSEPPPESVENSARAALKAYKDLLRSDYYDTLEGCANDILNSNLSDVEKSDGIADLFATLSEMPGAMQPLTLEDKEADMELSHDHTHNFLDTYNNSETDSERQAALEKYGTDRVMRMMEKGASFSDDQTIEVGTINHQFKISVEQVGDSLNFTITDTTAGDTASFEVGA